MFDWFWNILGYETNHSERKKWVNKKIEEEKDLADFEEKVKQTPSFSKCVIPKKKTYKETLLKKGSSPKTPPRRSKRIGN